MNEQCLQTAHRSARKVANDYDDDDDDDVNDDTDVNDDADDANDINGVGQKKVHTILYAER